MKTNLPARDYGDFVKQEIFHFEQTAIDSKGMVKGRFRATGIRPKFVERFKAAGITVPPDLFNAEKAYEI